MPYTELERVTLKHRLQGSCTGFNEVIFVSSVGEACWSIDRGGRCGSHGRHPDCACRKSATPLRLDRRALRVGLRRNALDRRTEGLARHAATDCGGGG